MFYSVVQNERVLPFLTNDRHVKKHQMKDRRRTWPHFKADCTHANCPRELKSLGIRGSQRAGSQHLENGMRKIKLCPQLFS